MGLISVPGVTDGTVIDATDINIPINTIVNEINGKLDTNNFANSAVTTNDIADDAVTDIKLSDSLKTRLTKLETSIYASGYVAGPTSVSYKDLVEQYNSGITKTDNTTYTVQVAGIYYMHFQQLISATGTAPYLMLRINNSTVRQAWHYPSQMGDMSVSDLRPLSVGDTIRLYQNVAVAGNWTAQHSGYQIILIQRT